MAKRSTARDRVARVPAPRTGAIPGGIRMPGFNPGGTTSTGTVAPPRVMSSSTPGFDPTSVALANRSSASSPPNAGIDPTSFAAAQATGASPFGGSNYPAVNNAFTADPQGTTPITGWAKDQGFSGIGLDALQREPADIIAALIGGQMPQATPLFSMMEPIADDINALYMLSKGMYDINDPNALPTASDTVNWMANQFAGLMQPGGWQTDVREMMNNLYNAGIETPLGAFVRPGTPDQQVRNVMSLMAAAADAGMNPLMGQALLNYAGIQGGNYRNAVNTGQTNQAFTDFLRAL